VTRNEDDIVTERPEPIADRRNQRIEIAFRKIGTANRALEQYVANDRQAARLVEENHVPRRMARTMQDVHFDLAERYLVALDEPAVRSEGTHVGKAEHPALHRHAVNPELVFALRSFDRQGQTIRQISDGAGVVDVTVRDENFLQLDAVSRNCSQDTRYITTRVYDGTASGLLAPEQAAVLLEGSHRDDLIFHVRRS